MNTITKHQKDLWGYFNLVCLSLLLFAALPLAAEPLEFVTFQASSQYYPSVSITEQAVLLNKGDGTLTVNTAPTASGITVGQNASAANIQSNTTLTIGTQSAKNKGLLTATASTSASSLESATAAASGLQIYKKDFPTPESKPAWKPLTLNVQQGGNNGDTKLNAKFLSYEGTPASCEATYVSAYGTDTAPIDTCNGDINTFIGTGGIKSFCTANPGKTCMDAGLKNSANDPDPGLEPEWGEYKNFSLPCANQTSLSCKIAASESGWINTIPTQLRGQMEGVDFCESIIRNIDAPTGKQLNLSGDSYTIAAGTSTPKDICTKTKGKDCWTFGVAYYGNAACGRYDNNSGNNVPVSCPSNPTNNMYERKVLCNGYDGNTKVQKYQIYQVKCCDTAECPMATRPQTAQDCNSCGQQTRSVTCTNGKWVSGGWTSCTPYYDLITSCCDGWTHTTGCKGSGSWATSLPNCSGICPEGRISTFTKVPMASRD